MEHRGFTVRRQVPVPLEIDGLRFDEAFRIDLLVDQRVVVELKSLEKLAPVHTKQVLPYLRLMNLEVGLLMNFGGAALKEGLRRIVNGYAPRCSLRSLGFSASPRDARGCRGGTEPSPGERV